MGANVIARIRLKVIQSWLLFEEGLHEAAHNHLVAHILVRIRLSR
jgi:hypothetical protein